LENDYRYKALTPQERENTFEKFVETLHDAASRAKMRTAIHSIKFGFHFFSPFIIDKIL
jgi:putative component of toxin-antitoxin plasmid stabilization module